MSTGVDVDCTTDALRVAEEHVLSDVSREVGGVLVGTIADGKVSVSAAVPAEKAVGAAGHVTFTHEVWEEVLPIVDRQYPESRIVGWYHSHPGFGIFLSEYDKFIQDNFFADPAMVALVIDPLAGEGGWFRREDGTIELVEKFTTRRGQRPAVVAEASRTEAARRGTRLLTTAAVVIAAFVAGYLFRGGDKGDGNRAALDRARNELAASRAAQSRLTAELDRAKSEPAAAPATASTGPAPVAIPETYLVHRGDTLWSIAERLLGSGYEWPRIARANPGLDPNLIITGRQLTIPRPT